MSDAIQLLISDNRGIYIPRDFCTDFTLETWGLSEDDPDVETCRLGPDEEWYWEAWDNVMQKAKHILFGHTLYQDGDLWAINVEQMTDEEKANWGFDND